MQTEPPKKSSPTNPLPECPITLLDFQRMFSDEMACLRYLEKMRWPGGFVCAKCSVAGEPFRFAARPRALKCRSCHEDSSVTAGTIMHRSKTNILVWFWAAYLIATQTPGVSALELQKRLGIERYETAFQILHKLRAAMVRPGRDKIGIEWPIELDVVYIGGKHKSGVQGATYQVPVIIAVEIRSPEARDPKTRKLKRALAGRIRLQVLPDKSSTAIDSFAKECIATGAVIISDGGTEFTNLIDLKFKHQPVAMRGDRAKMDANLAMISRVTANLKTWIDGTFHGVGKQHLQTYLNEFTFRFNRRFFRAVSF
jgi:ISXO2-like transposase domain/Transposase zinc-ribbon domain